MPYIKPEDRLHSDVTLGDYRAARDPGTLNFQITTLCVDYFMDNNKNYQAFNDIVGALECAKLELYRRMIGPYEDLKCQEHGDVYI